MFISQKEGQELGAQIHVRTNNRILRAIEGASHAVTTSKLSNFDEVREAQGLYQRSKELYETLPYSKGSARAYKHLMTLHRFIVDSQRVLDGEEFDRKSLFLVNLIHKAGEKLDGNNTERAMQLYSKAMDVFSSLSSQITLQHKKDNMQKNLKQLYEKIMFHKELEQERKAHKVLHSLEVLLQRCSELLVKDKKTARKLLGDIQKVYGAAHIPDTLLWKKAGIKKQVDTIQQTLAGKTKSAPPNELFLSDELHALITADHGLKDHARFEEFVQNVREIEMCGIDHFDEARKHFEIAKNVATHIQADKKAHRTIGACLAKIRRRFEILAGLERVKHAKHRGDTQKHLAIVQRDTLEYNKRHPREQAFTDKIYEQCALLHSVVEKGQTVGEILES